VKVVLKICKARVLKIIKMTAEKLSINRIKNKAIVLLIKPKTSKRKCIVAREFSQVLDNNEDLSEINMVNKIKEVITDYLGTKDTHQHKTIQTKAAISTFNNNNNNKKWECLVYMDLIKEDVVDHQNRRRRVKTTNNL